MLIKFLSRVLLLVVIACLPAHAQRSESTFDTSIGATTATNIISVINQLLIEDCNIPDFSTAQCAKVIQTQEQADQYQGQTQVIGDLIISPQRQLDLSPFDSLLEITGSLIFSYSSQNSINGFNNLRSIGKSLEVTNNSFLATVGGFQDLQTIGIPTGGVGSLRIRDNPNLTEVDSFSALTALRDLLIRNNSQLSTLSGFDILSNVRGSVIIDQIAVSQLPAFGQLETIRFGLILSRIPLLSALPSFQSLTSIENISLAHLDSLTTISGFNGVPSLLQQLNIGPNLNLHTISGFAQLSSVGGSGFSLFYLSDNPKLGTITGLGNLSNTGVNGDIYVIGNSLLDCPATLSDLEPMFLSIDNLNNCSSGP